MKSILFSAVFASICTISMSALEVHAQKAEPALVDDAFPTLEQARAAFLQGRHLLEGEDWLGAEAQFRHAARVRRTPGLLYYIAYCLEQQGRVVDALRYYEESAELQIEVKAADVETLIPEAIERLQGKISQVKLEGIVDGADVRIDDQPTAWHDAIPLDPGIHDIAILMEGYEPFRKKVDLPPAATEVVYVKLRPLVNEQAGGGEVDEGRDLRAQGTGGLRARPLVFWSSMGLGALGIGVGVFGTVSYFDTLREERRVVELIERNAQQPASACIQPETGFDAVCGRLKDSLDGQQKFRTVMVVGYSAAAVGTLGAILTHLLWKESTVQMAPRIDETGAAFLVSGRF